MNRHRSRRLAFAALVVAAPLTMAAPASAHHSFGAFDRNKEMTVTGTVKTWRWANPHPTMIIVVADKPGADPTDYTFEWPAPLQLQEKGWTRKLATVGDKVTIKFNPWRSGSPGGLFQDITSADGKSLKAR